MEVNYIVNFMNGRSHWAEEVDIKSMISLISEGVVINMIDIKEKRALLMNQSEGQKNIGYAKLPKHADFEDELVAKLEDNYKNTGKDLD